MAINDNALVNDLSQPIPLRDGRTFEISFMCLR